MTESQPASILSISDADLCDAVASARTRLFLMAPGVSKKLAIAIATRWKVLGPNSVELVLDVDPEVCRLGYGDLGGLLHLQRTALELGKPIRHQPGIRIGLLIADGEVTFFSPTPLLIEAGSTQPEHPNAVRLGFVPIPLVHQLGLGGRKSESTIGKQEISEQGVQQVAEELKANPPLKFDVARTIRVFNSQLEFVELELKGGALSRKTIPIPNELLRFIKGKATRNRMRSNFRLLDAEEGELYTNKILKKKNLLVKNHLVVLPKHGTVILRSNKPQFEEAVKELQTEIEKFRKDAKDALESVLKKNRDALIHELLPALAADPPEDWRKRLQPGNEEGQIRKTLSACLEGATGDAEALLGEIELTVRFKGITYETLTDPGFEEAAMHAFPALELIHEEFETATGQGMSRDEN